MSVKELIAQKVSSLPQQGQNEVLEFVELLLQKSSEKDEELKVWNEFSLEQAMRGLEDEAEIYALTDLKERWQ